MPPLENLTTAALHAALEDVGRKKPTKRLLFAILYKEGPSVPMIAEWFDVRERTIYDWFDRMEAEPLDRAIRDRPRPGRPSRLSVGQRAVFEHSLADSPAAYGFEAATWTPAVTQAFIERRFDVEYSHRHVRRLLVEVRD